MNHLCPIHRETRQPAPSPTLPRPSPGFVLHLGDITGNCNRFFLPAPVSAAEAQIQI